jgi:hypothetical protein
VILGLPNRRRRGPSSRGGDTDLESRLIWILGSPRSGTSWLMDMLSTAPSPGITSLDEPRIGDLLITPNVIQGEEPNPKVVTVREMAIRNPNYVLSEQTREIWSPWLAGLVLDEFGAALHKAVPDRRQRRGRFLVLKEPNSSEAADEIAKLLPRSRVIFLLRDGRDVVDSTMDVLAKAGWGALANAGQRPLRDDERPHYAALHSVMWVYRTEAVQRACDFLPPGQSLLVRYEDLRADTHAELERIMRWIGIETPPDWVEEVARGHAFEALPAEAKGPGSRRRAAQPGLWRENLSETEQEIMETIMGPKLRELGYTV